MKKADGFVGVISDTHGLLRPEALAALSGAELIIHAGDIGRPEIIPELRRIAPVTAVRGNVDNDAWAREFPETQVVELGKTLVYVIHNLNELDASAVAAGIRVVISGHTHKALAQERAGALYLNPGSAGPRRFSLPVTLARLRVTGDEVEAEIVKLI